MSRRSARGTSALLSQLVLSLLGFRTRRYGGDAQLKQRLDLIRAKGPLPQTTIRLRHPEWSQRNAHLVGGVRVSNPGAALLGVGRVDTVRGVRPSP